MFRRLFFLWPLCLTVASGADATSILSALKAASGGEHWDQIKTIHVRAAFEQGDLRGTSDTWLDIPHAFSYSDQTVVSPTLGTLHSINGWNGNVSWSADQTGDVWITESEEARRNAFTAAYIDTFGYLFPPRFPVQFTIGPDTAIEVRPSSGVPFDLEIDPASHLIQRIVQTQGVEKPVLALSDYRPAAGVLLPFRQVETRPGSAFTVTTTVTSVEIDVAPPPHIFDPPEPRLTGVEFPPGHDAVTMDFRYIDSEIYLPVSINGHALEKFAFDIGSTNTIDNRVAKQLGLKVEASGLDYGGGPDASPAGLTRVDRIEIGGLVMRDQVIGTSVLPGEPDDQLRGTIGYELARRTIVVIDYANHRITFRKPQSFRPPANATAMPFQFAQVSQVLVKASIDGIPGDFQLDTGMSDALELNRPFAARNGFLARYGAGEQGQAKGIGGVAPVVAFAQTSFTIGKLQPWVPHTVIALAESGSSVQEFVAGTIGNRILQQFTLTLDYGHRMVYFEKNPSYGKPDSGDEESGVDTFTASRNPDLQNPNHDGWLGFIKWTRPRNKPIEIVELAPDGPAAKAGIVPGDLITEVNGIPVEELSGVEVARALIAPPGSPVRLTIKGKTEIREFILRTL
jgi:hypothetical protein